MSRVEGKVAIVTGGALGIGRAACLLLAQEGAKVAVADVLDGEGRGVAGEINRAGGNARFWPIDPIVMSTHSLTGLKRRVFGSVADQVLRYANKPVLLVRVFSK